MLDLAVFAQVLTGEPAKALWHWRWVEVNKPRLSHAEEATMHFALGLGHTRVSEYHEARDHFACNRKFVSSSLRAAFYFYQGLGFYRFFTASYARSVHYAEKALEFASQDKFALGQTLAEELLGHSLIESGEIRRGIKHLKSAQKRAVELQNPYLQQSFSLNLLFYEARFGLDWRSLTKLERALKKLHPRDLYTRNSVKLELANQWTLRGRIHEAFEVLDEACDSVYSSQNRRQIAHLNFRLAYLTWLRGGQTEALHLLKSAETQLHKEVDHAAWMKMRGLQSRILKRPLSDTTGRENQIGIHARIMRRESRSQTMVKVGEDRLGDIYDAIHARDSQALKLILEKGLYYFLYDYFELQFDQKAILFDLLPKGATIIDRGNIEVIEKGISRVMRKILEALAQSFHSKEDLIRAVWGYQYDAERHDPLVYTSMSKLRQILGRAGEWIEVDEKGYRLQSGVRVSSPNTAVQEVESKKTATVALRANTNTALSFRQLRILKSFDTHQKEAIGIEDVMRDFEVSRATATRDLTQLASEGYLLKLGKARATRYLLQKGAQ